MNELSVTGASKLRIFAAFALITISVFFILILPSLILSKPTVHAAPEQTKTNSNPLTNNSPNVITSGLFNTASGVQKITGATQRVIYESSVSVRDATFSAGTNTSKAIVRGFLTSGGVVVHGIGSSSKFVGHFATKPLSLVSNVSKVNTIITPASVDSTPVPIISGGSAQLADNKPVENPAPIRTQTELKTQPAPAPQWPIHGLVTLEFGVPHWPFQRTHTGIDVSDGAASGVTAVHPFEAGVVKEAGWSRLGFGNHVVIDHGNGLTSLYGHLASVAVQVGQQVDESSLLGYEGNTGASQGVHVHFEIQLNGIPQNPRKYVGGQP